RATWPNGRPATGPAGGSARAAARSGAPPCGTASTGLSTARRSTRSVTGAGTGRRVMGRWTIINGLLAVIVLLLGFEIMRTWARGLPPIEVPPAPAAPAPAAGEPHEKGKRAAEKANARAQQTPPALVTAIVEKDLFDPSRHPPAPDEVKVEAAAPVTKPPDG